MPVIDTLTLDQLGRLLSFLRWTVVFSGLIFAGLGILTQRVSDRISTLQKKEKEIAEERLSAAEEKLMPRIVSDDQAAYITEYLRRAVADGGADTFIVVASRMLDAESADFGRGIFTAIEASGWPCRFTEMSTLSFSGVSIYYNPRDSSSRGLAVVREAVAGAGIGFSTEFRKVEQIPIQHAPCIYIVIGHK